jgi:hypothetical protein
MFVLLMTLASSYGSSQLLLNLKLSINSYNSNAMWKTSLDVKSNLYSQIGEENFRLSIQFSPNKAYPTEFHAHTLTNSKARLRGSTAT